MDTADGAVSQDKAEAYVQSIELETDESAFRPLPLARRRLPAYSHAKPRAHRRR